jgi:hypothetical protein
MVRRYSTGLEIETTTSTTRAYDLVAQSHERVNRRFADTLVASRP